MPVIALAFVLLLAGAPAFAASGFGRVEFANSGARSAQSAFLEGLALLHDFEYSGAATAFLRAQAADPGFAMAYWGEAMTLNHPIWMQQDSVTARAVLKKLAPTAADRRNRAKSDREKAFLDAVEVLYGDGNKLERDFRYEAAMAKLHERYPEDVDAAAFYGLAILGTAHAGRDVGTYMRAASVLEEAWQDHRDHPGLVHYLIHSYDDPAHAPLGLRAARIYAKLAPDAGHAQHMTSHIFLALGMWSETVEANVAAIAAVNRVREKSGKKPLCCGHYPTWLGYAYLQRGELEKARTGLAACRNAVETEVPPATHADHSTDPDNSLSGSFANMRLRYLLEAGDWSGEIAGWPPPKSAGPGARLDFAFAKTLAGIQRGDAAASRQALGELETASREAIELETKRGESDPTYRVRPEICLLEARALISELEGDLTTAERHLRDAAGLEDKLPIAFGPPSIEKPTRELLGEFLLRRDRKLEARAEFEKALARTPGRRLAEQGLAKCSSDAISGGGR